MSACAAQRGSASRTTTGSGTAPSASKKVSTAGTARGLTRNRVRNSTLLTLWSGCGEGCESCRSYTGNAKLPIHVNYCDVTRDKTVYSVVSPPSDTNCVSSLSAYYDQVGEELMVVDSLRFWALGSAAAVHVRVHPDVPDARLLEGDEAPGAGACRRRRRRARIERRRQAEDRPALPGHDQDDGRGADVCRLFGRPRERPGIPAAPVQALLPQGVHRQMVAPHAAGGARVSAVQARPDPGGGPV
eukprot:CAMPEP_0179356930 /NCGR_PEP_ID=MMETSP0797-20121207/78143_1 /TAXON_ID=47934 /ORGANISM="Dinophysis acuminata, Strain DAEP01" /LENGTH=243 /DNA_ID=CAMNT_0021072125 /DNA_START=17 /DNA_END=744 /DNA_ORIENTATION=+